MELKPGYKQTEVGVIPEDWVEISVGQLITAGIIQKPLDGNHGNIHPKSGDFVDYGIPFIMANNVQNGKVDLVNCSFIRKAQADSLQKGFSKSGDILLTHKATIGNTAIVGDLPFDYIMLTPQVTYYRVTDSTKLNNHYLRQFFDSTGFQSVLRALAGGGTRSYIGIKAQHQLPVVLPPRVPEQRAIAEALGDVDALLLALDRLIAKKRDLKQATMQQLLTGQTRLPGFEGEWEVKRLGDICFMKSGEAITSANIDNFSQYPCYGGNGLRGFTACFTHEGRYALIGRQGALCGNVQGVEGTFFASEHAIVVTARPQTDIRWLACVLGRMNLNQYSESSAQPGLSVSKLLLLEADTPCTYAEQTAIAEVLSDMDAELAELEGRRDKTRMIKQGMMQELLTGRTRLL